MCATIGVAIPPVVVGVERPSGIAQQCSDAQTLRSNVQVVDPSLWKPASKDSVLKLDVGEAQEEAFKEVLMEWLSCVFDVSAMSGAVWAGLGRRKSTLLPARTVNEWDSGLMIRQPFVSLPVCLEP